MNPPDQPTRPWWRKKRCIAAGLLWLFIGYPLGEGPAKYSVARGWLPLRFVRTVYRPVELTIGRAPLLAGSREAYRGWWNKLGRRDRTRRAGGPNWEIIILSDVDQEGSVLTTEPNGDTFAARLGGREVIIENGLRTSDGGFAWDGPVTLDGQPVVILQPGTRRLSIEYFGGEFAIEAAGRSIAVDGH